MILNNLEGHSLVAGLFRCNFSTICVTFCKISNDTVSCNLSATAGLLVLIYSRVAKSSHYVLGFHLITIKFFFHNILIMVCNSLQWFNEQSVFLITRNDILLVLIGTHGSINNYPSIRSMGGIHWLLYVFLFGQAFLCCG